MGALLEIKGTPLSSIESWGPKRNLCVQILTTLESPTKEEQRLVSKFCEQIHTELLRIREKNDPESIKAGQEEYENLIACFADYEPIYVEKIPNQYHSDSVNSPWLIVTTKKGRIKIGWRKRVIKIDWSESDIKASPEILFPKEDVTKGDGRDSSYIHAWGYEKAKEYLNTILSSRVYRTQVEIRKILDDGKLSIWVAGYPADEEMIIARDKIPGWYQINEGQILHAKHNWINKEFSDWEPE